MTSDTYVNEKDFKHLNLSDTNIVKNLILHRNKVDPSLGSSLEVNQELSALYISLDSTVKECRFNEKQMNLLILLYRGNTIQDICKMNIGYRKSATYDMFNRMLELIVSKDIEIRKNINMEE